MEEPKFTFKEFKAIISSAEQQLPSINSNTIGVVNIPITLDFDELFNVELIIQFELVYYRGNAVSWKYKTSYDPIDLNDLTSFNLNN